MLAEKAGFKAIYLSGAGVANASFGPPDLAVTLFQEQGPKTGEKDGG